MVVRKISDGKENKRRDKKDEEESKVRKGIPYLHTSFIVYCFLILCANISLHIDEIHS